MNKCRYSAIKDFDINQANGISVSLWMQGCEHKCKGCYNKDTWDFNSGNLFTDEKIDSIIHLLTKDHIHKNLSVLGGESLSPNKREILERLFQKVKSINSNIEIWVWTGYMFEDVCNLNLLKYVDILIDGEYIEDLREISRFKGSSNQRIIDIQQSLKQNKIIEI